MNVYMRGKNGAGEMYKWNFEGSPFERVPEYDSFQRSPFDTYATLNNKILYIGGNSRKIHSLVHD